MITKSEQKLRDQERVIYLKAELSTLYNEQAVLERSKAALKSELDKLLVADLAQLKEEYEDAEERYRSAMAKNTLDKFQPAKSPRTYSPWNHSYFTEYYRAK